MAAMLRGAIDVRRRLAAARAHPAAVPGRPRATERSVNDGLVKILDGNTFVVSDERGDIEASLTDPTGLFSFDTRFLSRWVLTVDGERLSPLSVDDLQYFEHALLPRARDGHGVRRLEALGDPPAHGRERLPRGADDPEPRRRAGRPRRSRSRPAATSPTCSRSRTRCARRARTRRRSRAAQLALGYERETFERATVITSSERAPFDEDGLTFSVRIDAARRMDDRARRRHRVSAPARRRHASDPKRAQARMRRTSSGGSATHRASSATGSRSRRPTGAASSTSPRCASRR